MKKPGPLGKREAFGAGGIVLVVVLLLENYRKSRTRTSRRTRTILEISGTLKRELQPNTYKHCPKL
jgi:hypothetical protein